MSKTDEEMSLTAELRKHYRKTLKKKGLPMPRALPPIEEAQRFPDDLTALSDRELRQHLSFWTAHLARAEQVRAEYEAEELALKQQRDHKARLFRLMHEFGTKWESEAELSKDKEYVDVDNKYEKAKALVILVKGRLKAYEHYWNAISRELSARIAEHEREGRDRAR